MENFDLEFENKLSEIKKEFYESGLSIIDFIVKKFNENQEESSKNLEDLLYDNYFEKSNDNQNIGIGLFNLLK